MEARRDGGARGMAACAKFTGSNLLTHGVVGDVSGRGGARARVSPKSLTYVCQL